MKKVLASIIATASLAAVGVAVAPAANAVNWNACNQGTIYVGHDLGVYNPGLARIAYVCHS